MIKSCAAAAADFPQPLKGVQSGEQKWGTLLGKGVRWGLTTGLWIVRFFFFFQELIYEPNSYIAPIYRKVLNLFPWWKLFVITCKSFMRLAEIFWKNTCLIACIPPSPKSDYITFPLASLEQFLRAIWGAVSQALVLIMHPIKLNSQPACYILLIWGGGSWVFVFVFWLYWSVFCVDFSLVTASRRYSGVVVSGLLTAVASLLQNTDSRTCRLSGCGTWA